MSYEEWSLFGQAPTVDKIGIQGWELWPIHCTVVSPPHLPGDHLLCMIKFAAPLSEIRVS